MAAKDKQVGGAHYQVGSIQPIEFIQANNLDFETGSAIKYLLRHQDKGGREDLEKAKHYIDFLIEKHYPEKTPYVYPVDVDKKNMYYNSGFKAPKGEVYCSLMDEFVPAEVFWRDKDDKA